MWQNHNPFAPTKTPDLTPIPPAVRMKKAKLNPSAQYIHNDGSRIYKWEGNNFYYANWSNDDYGSWWLWRDEDIPTGELVEL